MAEESEGKKSPKAPARAIIDGGKGAQTPKDGKKSATKSVTASSPELEDKTEVWKARAPFKRYFSRVPCQSGLLATCLERAMHFAEKLNSFILNPCD